MDKSSKKWDSVRQIINPYPTSTLKLSRKFLSVLSEFKDVLNESPYMRAYLRVKSRDTNPQIWSLNTRPQYRPAEGSIMLNIAVYYDFVRILGEEKEVSTPDELTERLSHFVSDSFFPSTVANYQSMFSEDVAGALQTIKHNGPTTKDTIVILPWSEHNRLGEIAEKGGGKNKFTVRVEHMQGFPDYDEDIQYRFLCSMGYFLEISKRSPLKADCVEIEGQVEAFTEKSDEIY